MTLLHFFHIKSFTLLIFFVFPHAIISNFLSLFPHFLSLPFLFSPCHQSSIYNLSERDLNNKRV
nr:MAG TPA: hypothetical protein [Caudoviricetes sp.]